MVRGPEFFPLIEGVATASNERWPRNDAKIEVGAFDWWRDPIRMNSGFVQRRTSR